ncbi:MAG: hypothetical protein M1144_02310 [Candidatus Thermoplasmatota archaeon]|jgi:hypothetical protein|nr:hypothetical protein [Candidatus Thermoplasmatota archaeon]MCL5984815.1 hypothetical protein [Candidatus Thermoplasmatota archaeon]
MDTQAILLGLAERERWARRKLMLENQLARTQRRLKLAEKKKRRLGKELSRLESIATALESGTVPVENEGTSRLITYR